MRGEAQAPLERLLAKAVYELDYELNSRPPWLRMPLQGIRQLLEESS